MPERLEVQEGKAFCEECGATVVVKEKPGMVNTAQKRYVLVDERGPVIAERSTRGECWEKTV
jgi:hypothetical protein